MSTFSTSKPPSALETDEKHSGTATPTETTDLESKPVPPAVTFPEGGLQAWLTVAGGTMIFMCSFGIVQSFGVFQDYYSRETLDEHSASQISWIGSFQLFMLFFLGLPAGRLYDMGYFRFLIGGGSLLLVFSAFMLSLAKPHNYYQNFLAQGFGIGAGMGMIFLPAVSIPSQYFKRKRALAMGIVVAGGSAGGIFWPIMLNHLFGDTLGFGWGVRINGFIALVLLTLAFFFMKVRLPSRSERPDAPPIAYMPLFKDRAYLIAIAGTCFGFWGIFFPFFYLQLFANQHGIPSSLSRYVITIMNGASLIGRTLPNFLADRYGPFNVIILMTTVSGCLMFAMFGATTVNGVVPFAIFYGFFSGCFLSLVAPITGVFAKSVDDVGVRLGFGCFAWSFFLLTGNPISGALLKTPHYYWSRPIIFNAVMVLFGCGLLLISRSMVAKKKGTPWV